MTMRLADKSATSLTWLAVLLLAPGFLIQSPSGRFFFLVLSGLVALVPLIFGTTKRRLQAGIVAAISLVMVVNTYPEFGKDQDAYRERVRQKHASPAGN